MAKEKDLLRVLVKAYSGVKMVIGGYDLPVVIDLAGMKFGNSLVANLDHDRTKRVGNVVAHDVSQNILVCTTDVNASTVYADEVERSIDKGFQWQASIEAVPVAATELAGGESVTVNGRTVNGPCYVISKSILKGFAFVSHGADDNTSVMLAQRRSLKV